MRIVNNGSICHESDRSAIIDVHPLSSYYFGSKSPNTIGTESHQDRLRRMEINYNARGLRTCVLGVMLVELFKYPHLLLLQARNSVFKLPGGRLSQGESDLAGLNRKLSKILSSAEDQTNWEVVECIGVWWRANFDTPLVPCIPPNGITSKECVKLFLVKLPESREFIVPRNLKLLAVPIHQLPGNSKTYGNLIAEVPGMLTKFSFHIP